MLVFDLMAVQYSGNNKIHGGGEYANIILNELINSGVQFACVFSSKLCINKDYFKKLDSYKILYIDCSEKGLLEAIRQLGGHTFYSAIPYVYGNLDFSGIRFVGTIHGLRDLEILSDDNMYIYESSLNGYLKSLIKGTGLYKAITTRKVYKRFESLFNNKDFRFVVVSLHTKYAIKTFFPKVELNNIRVYYSPSLVERTDHLDSSESFYLMVSGNRWLKNVYRAVLAIDDLLSKGLINHKVKITGSPSPKMLKKIKNLSYFEFLPYVTNEELALLMRQAYCFIYPSLNEGFGYPPLQAMACGTPAIVSSCCSIPEVCGNGALYFNPYSIAEIENRLMQIEDTSCRNSLVINGYKRFAQVYQKQSSDLKDFVSYILTSDE